MTTTLHDLFVRAVVDHFGRVVIISTVILAILTIITFKPPGGHP